MNDDDAISSSALSPNNATTTHHRHFKMYKPAKVLTQFKFTHRKRRNRTLLGDVITAADTTLLPSNGVMAIGRLDEDSEGLLLLTTDGKVSEQVRRKSVEKEYYVQLDGKITQEAIERLQLGVEISLPATNNHKHRDDDGDERSSTCESTLPSPPASTTTSYTTMPCKARFLDTSIITVENKKNEATTKEEDHSNQPSETETKPNKRKRRKFGGTCNRCKQAGHKAKDCTDNPVDLFNTNNNCNNNNDNVVQLALPAGIIPPPPSRNGYYNIRNTTSRPTSWISITINEGKNRQVRRMTAAVGYPTLRLVRVKIGCVGLDGMVAGEVRELSEDVMDSII
ncbi:pseudouridine synthase, RluE family [Skeletonema marinoi]|uniref:Pseudouridine synthase, RluE family n=1 Tax=Skeletonema marinoi TaxID=267567 RepID=A0AAD8XV23_9STRA|nr:pseudouridine synthase, RluE family [Skeletonema marinoi]